MTESEKISKLLAPRIKMIAPVPEYGMKVGTIITEDERQYFELRPGYKMNLVGVRQYPHIYRELHWSEERNETELPKYIGWKNEEGKFNWVYPIVKFTNRESNGEPFQCIISYTNKDGEYHEIEQATWGATPATSQDFINYQTKVK